MEKYEIVEIEVICFGADDVITASQESPRSEWE